MFHWDDARVCKAWVVKDFASKGFIEIVEHPQYSPDLATADFWLFRKIKGILTGDLIEESSIQTRWEWAVCTINTEEFMLTFNKCMERQNKYMEISVDK